MSCDDEHDQEQTEEQNVEYIDEYHGDHGGEEHVDIQEQAIPVLMYQSVGDSLIRKSEFKCNVCSK